MQYPEPILWDVKDPSDVTWRKDYFGTSHTAVLFNDHPFETAAEYWLNKRDGVSKPTTDAMERGNYLEDAVAVWFAEREDTKAWQKCAPTTRGHLIAIPDREQYAPLRLMSVKTTRRSTTEPDKYWIWQAQAEMLVTGVTENIIVWLNGGLELNHATIEYDADMGAEIWQRSEEFMRSLKAGTMPTWVERSARDITRQYPELSDANRDIDDDGIALVRDYAMLKAEAKKYADAADALRDQIFVLAEDAPALMYQGEIVASLRMMPGRPGFNAKGLRAKYPELADEFTTQGEPYRRLDIAKTIREEAND